MSEPPPTIPLPDARVHGYDDPYTENPFAPTRDGHGGNGNNGARGSRYTGYTDASLAEQADRDRQGVGPIASGIGAHLYREMSSLARVEEAEAHGVLPRRG